MSSYFTLPSFARAKKNQEELQKSNPQNPVLKDDDEEFLTRHLSQDRTGKQSHSGPVEVTKISDDGTVKEAPVEEGKASAAAEVLPETQPGASGPTQLHEKSSRKSFDLPSQEEAEAVTRGWNAAVKLGDEKDDKAVEKRTWASYLPQKLKPGKSDTAAEQPGKAPNTQTSQRSWGEYASDLIPSVESLNNVWPDSWTWSKDKDAKAEPVLNEDGTVNEEKTKEKQEKEVSVLLDNLNMSSINNRVFAFSDETQKYYERFAQCLKDTMNGVPTAYDDMDKLMREAGPQLEKQFKSMPPFVQTLVKSLPTKLGAGLAPEIMAAASGKPGADAKKMSEANNGSGSNTPTGKKSQSKKKRTIPGLKTLMSKEGLVATMLRNTVTFLTTRFPVLASATNVIMSLAVFSKFCSVSGSRKLLTNPQS
jgi:hypothetical protein